MEPEQIVARLTAIVEHQGLKSDLSMSKFDLFIVYFRSDKIRYAYHPPVDPDTKSLVTFLENIEYESVRFKFYAQCPLETLVKYKDRVCTCDLFDSDWYAREPFCIDQMNIQNLKTFLIRSLNIQSADDVFGELTKRAKTNENFKKALFHFISQKESKLFDRPIGRCPICFSHWGLPFF